MTRSRAGGRRATGWAALVAGLGALVAGAATLVTAVDPPDVGVVPAAVAQPSTSTPADRTSAASRAPAADRNNPAGGQLPASRSHPAPASRNRSPGPFVPTRVVISALHVTAAVDPVGVTGGDALVIPADPARVGWWIGSAMPGEGRGTVLLAGHVDTATDGPGALFELEKLPMGAVITVRAGGNVVTYRAVARRSYHKSRLPADLFETGTTARLVLITCGGAFHHGSYTDNVVLYAVPTT